MKLQDYLNAHRETSPLLVIDLEQVKTNYKRLRAAFPEVEIFYAMKANPHKDILKTLIELGSSIDAASLTEVTTALDLNCPPERISYGNVAKKSSDIRASYERGVRLYVFDCKEELQKIAKMAPRSQVFFRISVTGVDALLPLDGKFGKSPVVAKELLFLAKDLGLEPVGISFHVGSQQLNPEAWLPTLKQVEDIMQFYRSKQLKLNLINLGGGLPGPMKGEGDIKIEKFTNLMREKLATFCDMKKTRLLIEPGRYLVAESGILQTMITLNTAGEEHPDTNWVFLDCGRYQGLWEASDHQVLLPVVSPDKKGPCKRTILTGPTCDSFDTMYEKSEYLLPDTLHEGDRLWFLNAGAYSYSMGTDFNGFPSANTVCI